MTDRTVDTNTVAKGLGVTGFSPLANFLKLHIVKAMDDRVGNDTKLWNASNIEQVERLADRHGFDPGSDELMYDKVNPPLDYYRRGIMADVNAEAAKRAESAKVAEVDLVKAAEVDSEIDAGNLNDHPEVLQATQQQEIPSAAGKEEESADPHPFAPAGETTPENMREMNYRRFLDLVST